MPGELMQPPGMNCFGCGRSVAIASGERVGFRDECGHCGADLHVCCNCAHHDPAAYNECRESSAERVGDRERANRCEWFRPGTGEANERASEHAAAATELDALFKKR